MRIELSLITSISCWSKPQVKSSANRARAFAARSCGDIGMRGVFLNIELVRDRLCQELSKIGLKLLPPSDEIFAEEISRTCLVDPRVERVYFLPTTCVVANDRLVAECSRVFDLTTSSSQGRALYNIEELRKISKLGYSLHNGYLIHPHHQSYSPTPSITDLVAFFTTDAALGVSLNYLVVSATRDTVSVKAIDFKHCYDCAHFCRFLKGAPLVDSKIDEEVERR